MITNPTIEKKTNQTNKQTKQKNCDELYFLFQMPFAKKKNSNLKKTLKLSITLKNWENIQLVNHAISC